MNKKEDSYRIDEITTTLERIASLDFSNKLKVTNQLDKIDALSIGINMLSEELETNLIERSILKDNHLELYNNSPEMLLSISPEGGIVLECNDSVLKKTGYMKKEIVGHPVSNLYHPDCLSTFKTAFKSFQESGIVKNVELQIKKKDGTKIFVILNVRAKKDATGKVLYSNSSWTDVSEIVFLKKKLEIANIGLEQRIKERTAEKEILKSIVDSQEQIRNNLSENLHEGLAQTLSGLSYHLNDIESKLKAANNNELVENIAFIKKYLNKSIEESRSLAIDLMPRSLVEKGLSSSIQDHINTANYSYDIRLDSTLNGKELDTMVEITIYRTILKILARAAESSEIKTLNIQLSNQEKLSSLITIVGDFYIKKNEKGDVIDKMCLATHKTIEIQGGDFCFTQNKEENTTTISATF